MENEKKQSPCLNCKNLLSTKQQQKQPDGKYNIEKISICTLSYLWVTDMEHELTITECNKQEPKEEHPVKADREFLETLVDVVWQKAKGTEEVPTSKTVESLIKRAHELFVKETES